MKEFLFLVRGKDTASPEELQGRLSAYVEWMQTLVANGKFKDGHPLLDETRLVTSKSEVIKKGYFSDAKQLISGYLIIIAKDYDEATEIAGSCPLIEQFPIEVREQKIR